MVNSKSAPQRGRKEQQNDLASYIDQLKSRLDIVQVAGLHGISVNAHGQAQCFHGHDQKTPSLRFYDDTQTYHCFGCNAHGDVISLVQQQDGCSFADALNALAREAGMPCMEFRNGQDADLYSAVSDCLDAAAGIYHGWLSPEDEYLSARGLSYETARKFRIGRTRGRDDLRHALKAAGIAPYTMLMSGLVKPDGNDFFQDHIVVPITNRGRTVDFYGRSLSDQNGSRHWRLPNNRLLVGHGLFCWNPAVDEIILVEGVFDCLALVEHGFGNAVATFGTQGLQDRWQELIAKSRVKKVLFCYDGDASGRTAALRDALALEDSGKEVRIVRLPDDTDPNQYLQEHSQDDFQCLLDWAVSPFDHELERITAIENRDERLKEIRNSLLPRVKQAEPIMQPDLIKRIHERLDVSVRALNEQLKRVPDERTEQKQNVAVGSLKTIHPALDLVDGTMIIMAPKRAFDSESQAPCWENTVVTSERERFDLNNAELLKRGWYAPALERTDIRVSAAISCQRQV